MGSNDLIPTAQANLRVGTLTTFSLLLLKPLPDFPHPYHGYYCRASRIHISMVLPFSKSSSLYFPSSLAVAQIRNFSLSCWRVFIVQWDSYGHLSDSVPYTLHKSTSRYNGSCRARMLPTFLQYEQLEGITSDFKRRRNQNLTILVF